MKQKRRISDGKYRELLFKECSKADSRGHLKSNFYDYIRTEYQIEKQRCLQLHDRYYPEWLKINDKAVDKEITHAAAEGVRMGLKTRNERILFYQNEIERMEKQLKGEEQFLFIIGNKPFSSHIRGVFSLPIEKQNDIRTVIRSYQTEISKLEGDYAPAKQDITLHQPVIIEWESQ